MKYLDFDLLIERTGERYKARVLNSPAGQATIDFALPFSSLELENFLLKVGRPRRGLRRVDSPAMQSARQFGGRLFETIFDHDVRACLRSSLDEAKRQGNGLRLRLRLTSAPELAEIPWEYLYNPGLNRFLSLSVETPIVRYLDIPELIRPLQVKPPVRVLVMISSPGDYPQLEVENEWNNLQEALGTLESQRRVALERLEEATLGSLQKQLRRQEYHIFHFIGHGGFDRQTQDGVLILEDEHRRGHQVSGNCLGTLLHDESTLRLALLNACEGARTTVTDPFAGTAQSLVQQGIPAVIAMQFEVTDAAAITLAHEFYDALADGLPVDAALAEARKSIFAQGNDIEWGTPVLYMRSPDGRIFDIAKEEVIKRKDEIPTLPKPAKRKRSKPITVVLASVFAILIGILVYLWIASVNMEMSISTNPEGTTVFLNKTSIGMTPIKALKLKPGKFFLRLEKSGYLPVDTSIVVTKDQPASFTFPMQPAAYVPIHVNPPDAKVVLDGRDIDSLNLAKMELSAGTHRLTISRSGYLSIEDLFTVAEGENPPRKYSLKEKTPTSSLAGGVRINSNISGASVFLDNRFIGVTPFEDPTISSGSHQLLIRQEGYAEFSKRITVRTGATTEVTANLVGLGGLKITSRPTDATIFLNGKNIGVTPQVIDKLTVGRHDIVLKKNGYQDHSTTGVVEQRRVGEVYGELEPLVGELKILVKPYGAIYIDDQLHRENTELMYTAKLPIGTHRVKAVHPTLGMWEKIVQIKAGQPNELQIDFNKKVSLTVASTPWAEIYVDGKPTGYETPRRLTLNIGMHIIEVRRQGYVSQPASIVINLEEEITEPLRFTLKPVR